MDGAMLIFYLTHYFTYLRDQQPERQSSIGSYLSPKGKYSDTLAIAYRESQVQDLKQLKLTRDTYSLAYKALHFSIEKQLRLVECEWAQAYQSAVTVFFLQLTLIVCVIKAMGQILFPDN